MAFPDLSAALAVRGNVRANRGLRREVNVFEGHEVNGVLDAGLNVRDCQIRIIIPDNVGETRAFADQLEHVLHRNARAGEAGFFKMG